MSKFVYFRAEFYFGNFLNIFSCELLRKMSKAPSHPIILKKDDSQRSSRSQAHQPIQPKILTKSSKENIPAVVLAQKKIIEVVKEQPALTPSMKTFQRMIYPHFQLDQKILDYLDAENTDFLVVGGKLIHFFNGTAINIS